MKRKATERPMLTKSGRVDQPKLAVGAGGAGPGLVSRSRPFLVHALRLRSQKPLR
jgi:hypothetical protein